MKEIATMFHNVVAGNHYDLDKANEHHRILTEAKVLAHDMPDIESDFIAKNHFGCCLHFAMALLKQMKEAGYNCLFSVTLEEDPKTHEKTDSHCSVCYKLNGERFIADPVEAVKTVTDKDFSHISIKEYSEKNGIIWLYDPYGEDGTRLFFEDFMCYPVETFDV